MVQTVSPSKLDLTKPVQTRDGRKVRILCTDRDHHDEYPVVGLVGGEVETYQSDGQYFPTRSSCHDLVNAPVTVRVCFFTRHGRTFSSVIRNPVDEVSWIEEYDVICVKDIVLDT